jgi:hypothetical protein
MTFHLDALGFHVGMIVGDVHTMAEDYRRLLGGQYRIWEFVKEAPSAVNPDYEDSRLRICYGRFGGMTIELVQVLEGDGHYARWQTAHGYGVQHIGFWVPDLSVAVQRALDHGATIASARIDERSLGSITLQSAPADKIAAALLPGSVHLLFGSPSTEIELAGEANLPMLLDEFGDALGAVVDVPPWFSNR